MVLKHVKRTQLITVITVYDEQNTFQNFWCYEYGNVQRNQ